jgi:hypothetical protein
MLGNALLKQAEQKASIDLLSIQKDFLLSLPKTQTAVRRLSK